MPWWRQPTVPANWAEGVAVLGETVSFGLGWLIFSQPHRGPYKQSPARSLPTRLGSAFRVNSRSKGLPAAAHDRQERVW